MFDLTKQLTPMESSELLMEDERESTVRRVPADNVMLKILVPSVAAGAIIGKGGEAIAQLQKDNGVKVKMSKATDFYPGTTERVCLIQGNVDSILSVCDYIMEKVLEKPDPNPRPSGDGKLNVERHKQIKILVPNSTAGMIIGKKGNYVKEIMDSSGSYVQISQKPKEQSLSERCVTVAGDLESNRAAVNLILEKISEDPQSASCPNISYSEVSGPVASAYPTGSPYAAAAAQAGVRNPIGHSGQMGVSGNASSAFTQLSLEALRGGLRHSGFTESAAEEIVSAMTTLQTYGFFNLQSLVSSNVPALLSSPGMSAFGLQAAGGSVQAQAHAGDSAAGQSSRAFDAFQSGYVDDEDDKQQSSAGVCKRDIEVPESLVGVVIGPGGKDIVELQAVTQTSIQVSKRGEYQGQTRNRIVSITGTQLNVNRAERIIQQRVNIEENRRQQHQQQSGAARD